MKVLQGLDAAKEELDWQSQRFRALRKALAAHAKEAFGQLPQKNTLDARARAKYEKNAQRERRQRQVAADRKLRDTTALRAARQARLDALESEGCEAHNRDAQAIMDSTDALRVPDGPAKGNGDDGADVAPDEEASARYERQQACYICRARFTERHHFYAALCPPCASLNFAKRSQARDLAGRVCIVTGARVKIGFETALKLLRMGARVIVTSRFPGDAARRYWAEPDAQEWRHRVEFWGVDFRFLGHVERFCDCLSQRLEWLDILVNNACQTIRRPAGYYRSLLEGEALTNISNSSPLTLDSPPPLLGKESAAGRQDLGDLGDEAAGAASVAALAQAGVGDLTAEAATGGALSQGVSAAAASQLQVLSDDALGAAEIEALMPAGELDAHDQQLDLRDRNSWLLKLGEVATPEAVEAMCINALAPFILNGRLRPLLERSPNADRYIVNVSAMEGKFYRWKQPTHPHTNMAKAALNMMTKTSAEEFAACGIYMNSVDTGWINDENPLPVARRIATDHGFQTPIDEVDAAARILDPVLTGMEALSKAVAVVSGEASAGDGPPFGKFLKDYLPTEW